MAELSELSYLHQLISSLLPMLATAVSNRNYTQHVVLLESLCRRVSIFTDTLVYLYSLYLVIGYYGTNVNAATTNQTPLRASKLKFEFIFSITTCVQIISVKIWKFALLLCQTINLF